MPKGRKNRSIVVPDAARATINILEGLGFTCVLEDDFAMYLRWRKPIPKIIRVMIVPSMSHPILPADVDAYLVREDPAHFQHHEAKGQKIVRYYDLTGLIPDGKKNFCDIFVVAIQDPPAFYTSPHVHRIDGLPVVGMVPVVLDMVSRMLKQYDTDQKIASGRREWPSDNQLCRLGHILEACKKSKPTPADAALHPDARVLLERLTILVPTVSKQMGAFMGLWGDHLDASASLMDGRDPLSTHELDVGSSTGEVSQWAMDGKD